MKDGGAQGVDVGAVVDAWVAAALFGRHVKGRAEQLTGRHALAGRVPRQRQAEVGDLDHGQVAGQADAGGGGDEEEVAGLDVAVDDAVAGGVGQCGRGLAGDGPGGAFVEPADALEPPAEVLALEQFHDDVQPAAVPAVVEHRDDVGVVEPAEGDRLRLEPRGQRRVGQAVDVDDLDGHDAVELELAGAEDGAEAAGADHALDLVARQVVRGQDTGALELVGSVGHGVRSSWARTALTDGRSVVVVPT